MKFIEFERHISAIRLVKYKIACRANKHRTLKLYRANIRLSGALLAVLCMFEIVLRNKIDAHYKARFPVTPRGKGWLRDATQSGGFLTSQGCHNSVIKINQAYTDLGIRYTHDRLVASLSFGFWKYLFKGNQYRAGGNTLLHIFPHKPPHTNQSAVFAVLARINDLRNRVGHHEPVCFGAGITISTVYARSHFQHIIDILAWMDINASELFKGVDGVIKECDFIDSI